MSEELEQILSQLTEPDNAVIQQATAKLKQAFKDPAIIPALCAVMSGSQNPQIRQSAAVMLRMRVKNHWNKISPNDRESLKAVVLQACMQESEHTVQHSLSQLCAVMVKHETPDSWPALLQLLNQATKSSNPRDRQVGLLLLNKVIESNPESFRHHYKQLLQLFSSVLQDHDNPTALYYCILSLTAITAFTGTEEMNQMRSIIPGLIVALKHLIQANQDQASEAMEVFNELIESEVSIIVPHVADVVGFCLEVGGDTTLSNSLRVKALFCIASLIKLKSKTVLKQKLLSPILQAIFPVLTAAPPPGEQDPEDQEEDDSGDDIDNANPKHSAAQVIDTMALHMPPEKLFQQLMPLTQACLADHDPYQKKGGLMCLAVLAEGCADHIRTKMLSSVLQAVCRSLSDSNQVVRSAGLFALRQFSEHLQPDVSKYCAELMPLLLGYLSSLKKTKVGHITKAFYALENFMENLGADIEPYLPTLMDTMLSALNTDNLRIEELAASAIGSIAYAAKELLVPYFPPVIESLKGFLTTTTEEMRSLQIQSMDTLALLAHTIGTDVFSPLAAECVQLGLNLMDTIDDPDLRRCTYCLYSAVSAVSPGCLNPHLSAITTVMLMALKSSEGITAHLEEDKTFVLLDDDDNDDNEEDKVEFLDDETDTDALDVAGFSVENSYIDEKGDACYVLGEIAFNSGVAFQPFLESCFQQVYEMRNFPHRDVRRAAFGAMGQFCRAQHKVWKENPTEANHQALLKLLDVVFPCFVETVRKEPEHQVVMRILKSMNKVIKTCKEEVFRNPSRLKDISYVLRDVLKKKTVCQDSGGDEADDEDQEAEYDAMLLKFAGEGIPLLASSVPADSFAPFLNDLLPFIMGKAKSTCTVAERSFAVGTIGEILEALINVPGGRGMAGRLSNRLLPTLVAGAKDSDAEVRNNSVFGLGCLAQAAGPIVVSDYPMMLSVFSNLLSKESDLRVIDNLCGALCRMIMGNVDAVPLEQVVPVLVTHLPLKEDMAENKTVYTCLAMLYTHSPALVVNLMKPIIAASSHIIGNKKVDKDTQETLVLLMKNLAQNHCADFQAAVTSLPAQQQASLSAVITAS
ncbi:importin-4-like [Parambassis ranga]|uniref:Importin-4-like n=1 Tax=Parambassis ranga TaxID=210632 RepID=A0A6P7KGE8_9TELE|nr:importin-4-like [Parambassis ranga]